MKKIALFLALLVCGCGSSGSGNSISSGFDFSAANGNFITSTVDVERQFLYTLNKGDNSLSVFLLDDSQEEAAHVHSQALFQEDEAAEFTTTELDGSPYSLGSATLVDMMVDQQGRYLVTLDTSGTLHSYGIDGITGLLTQLDERTTAVASPRSLERSYHGGSVAVLGEVASLHQIDADGKFSNGAVVTNTVNWTGIALNGNLAVGATPNGAASFLWSPGFTPSPINEVTLPGASRGQVTYSNSGVWVLNRADGSVSNLSQQSNGDIALNQTFALPTSLTQPRFLASLHGGQDLAVADEDTFALLHPGTGNLETEAQTDLPRVPNRIFGVPGTPFVLLGHDTGTGSTLLHIADGETVTLEVQDPGPGGNSPFGFGYASRLETVTQTKSI